MDNKKVKKSYPISLLNCYAALAINRKIGHAVWT